MRWSRTRIWRMRSCRSWAVACGLSSSFVAASQISKVGITQRVQITYSLAYIGLAQL